MQKEPGSFRDRSGFVFYSGGKVFRAVHYSYKSQYEQLVSSGLYDVLVQKGFLIPHREVERSDWPSLSPIEASSVFNILEPEPIPYISYPYEWCFQQLKEAALLTLHVQQAALEHGMVLKDASAFNIQFVKGRPLFIDTLSFDRYEEGRPWVAYRQFCMHFLSPLLLMSYLGCDLQRLSQLYLDGIPLPLASGLLPFKSRFHLLPLLHLHQHARLETKHADRPKDVRKKAATLPRKKLDLILQHLRSGVAALRCRETRSEWSDYYQEFSYSPASIEHKLAKVKEWVSAIAPNMAWDLGANTGLFSELIQPYAQQVVAFDVDHLAIERLYIRIREKNYANILPLVLNLNNPTPAIGWGNRERKSFSEKGKADLVLALALIHHLSIGNNLPFISVAEQLHTWTEWLIIEFVPKEDSQAQRLLVTREDIFDDYTQSDFEAAFGHYFTMENKERITGTERTLYLLRIK